MWGISFLFILIVTGGWPTLKVQADQMYLIGGKKIVFLNQGADHLLISKSCSKNRKLKCEAFQALSKNPVKMPQSKLGSNPGSMYCRETLHQTVVIGLDKIGNEQTFCEFSDGSLIGTGSFFNIKLSK